MFVTLFLGVLNIETGKLNYCNAGHNYPYLVNDNKLKILANTHGTPLGAIQDLEYTSSEMNLEKGDMIYLYTDGVTEAIDYKEKQFGEPRLEELLKKFHADKAEDVAQAVLKDLTTFVGEAEQFDDITMLCLKWF
jgi:sigma-B regulation protein RsbU (phosphoserine phosphatase)